jgi:SSS family transporter
MGIKLTFWDYGAMLLYLVAVVLIGLWFSRNEKNSEDYLLGGRQLPWAAVGISCLMSLLSTYSLVMVPGEIFNHGLSLWVFGLLAPFLTILAFTVFVRFYFKLNSFTPFEYLEYRYDKRIRLLIAVLYTYARLVYLAMVLFATSKVFEGGAGWPAWITITVVGIIGILYTVMGGMKAVVWTDVMQFFVLVGGVGLAVIVLCYKIDGGFLGSITYAFEHGRGLNRFTEPDFYLCNPYVRLSFWLILLERIVGPFSMTASDQITIQRLLSTSSYKNAFKAQVTASFLSLPFTLILWFIGLAIFTFYSLHPESGVTRGDTAFFTFVATQLPPPIPGMILAAMLAAVMSTLDSGINSMAAIWLKEFHQKYLEPNMTDTRQVKVSRWATAIVGIIAVSIGLLISCSSEWLGQTVVEAATIFYAFDAIVFPAFLYAVLSKRANSTLIWITAAILWGLKCGTLTWYTVTKKIAQVWKPGEPMGLGGPISLWWIAIPLALCAALGILWLIKRKQAGNNSVIYLGLSLFPAGYAIATGLWFIASHYLVTDKPLTLSFQWVGFPVIIAYLLIGLIGLRLSKVQPANKYKGLILFDNDSEQEPKSNIGIEPKEELS